jgi:CHAT domain-containing protein
MAEFYRSLLEEGASPAEALRQAQNWLRRQPAWEEPFYWAPFVLQGAD